MIKIGLKTDPINTRFSYDWLFDLLNEEEIEYVQLGSFFELYSLPDDYFHQLREKAVSRNIKIKSAFTAHRELGGFFYNDLHMEKVARKNYERFIEVAALLGADYCGSNPGAVHRDAVHFKEDGIACYLRHMKELVHFAHEKGLQALTVEPMSCLAEPPTLPHEIAFMMTTLNEYTTTHPETVPVYLCSDITHGYVNAAYEIVHSNSSLFEFSIPWMAEFHFKNTDRHYNSTFGFSSEEQENGIIVLDEFKRIIEKRADQFPVKELVGYLEISGPKIGRDYSDRLLAKSLKNSIRAIRETFAEAVSE